MSILQRNHVQVKGTTGPVLIYGNGFGCNQDIWAGISPAFEATHTQVFFDYAGTQKHGAQAFEVVRYTHLEGYVQDLLDVCDALNLENGVCFVGHSVSCLIGLIASLHRPSLFKNLVLIGPTPCFLNHPPHYVGGFERADLDGLMTLMDRNYRNWASYLVPVITGNTPGDWSNALEKNFCNMDPVVARIFALTTFFADRRDELPKIKTPCLVLQHRHDALVPLAVGAYMHQHLAGSTLQVLDVTGHCAHISHPALVIKAMQAFC